MNVLLLLLLAIDSLLYSLVSVVQLALSNITKNFIFVH